MQRLFKRTKNFFIPSRENAYRPEILGKQSMLFFLGVILVAEGFLTAQVVGRGGLGDFLAAVVGSEIIELTNGERAQIEAPQLAQNALLTAAAQRKAEDMAARSYFSHVGPDGKQPWAWVAEAGYNYSMAGENLAVRFIDSSDVVDAWMDSPTHKANIVKPVYREIGVGVAQGTYKGSSATFVVQFFGTPRQVAAAPVTPSVSGTQAAPVSASQSATTPEVAGESVATQPAAAVSSPHQPSLAESLSRIFARIFAEPRGTTSLILGAIAVFLILISALVFLVRIQVQPVDLLMRGALVSFFALFLVILNAQVLRAPAMFQSQAAAVAESTNNPMGVEGGVIISDSGESTEYFFIEY